MNGARDVPATLLHEPLIAFGRSLCGDLDASLRREWLVSNGLGGYASATLAGALTRSYHGWLVAALDPPVERTVLVAAFDEQVAYNGQRFTLSTHEFTSGMTEPAGYRLLSSFHLEGALPVWVFAIGDALIERRIWMDYGRNATLVTYRLVRGSRPAEFSLTPLVTCRTFHALTRSHDHAFELDAQDQAVAITDGSVSYQIRSDHASFGLQPGWWWDFHFRQETARGLADSGDLFAPGTFRGALQTGESLSFLLTTEMDVSAFDAGESLSRAQQRQDEVLRQADARDDIAVIRQLVLSADQLIVSRPLPDAPGGRSIIAGYPWFNDWGRDTMISLPGLCLATGRFVEADSILRTFARYVRDGLLPNNFPDHAGVVPGYNTADATLWFFLAIDAYTKSTGSDQLARDLLPILIDIAEHHQRGTRFGIGIDPGDGLLRAGEPGVQLTWMDARVGDWVVTPRIGKPVEINALWYNALRILSGMLTSTGDVERASVYSELAERVKSSFLARFRMTGAETLADVVDGPEGDDWTIRPNQIFALSLPYPLVTGDEAGTLLDAIARSLSTDLGLRSLSPADPAYRGHYGGDQVSRDGSYHQGPVWGWLLGPYVEARYRLDGNVDAAVELLRPVVDHLSDAGLGSISEIFDGDPPHRPNGCIAQAWSVGETLRVWRTLISPHVDTNIR